MCRCRAVGTLKAAHLPREAPIRPSSSPLADLRLRVSGKRGLTRLVTCLPEAPLLASTQSAGQGPGAWRVPQGPTHHLPAACTRTAVVTRDRGPNLVQKSRYAGW